MTLLSILALALLSYSLATLDLQSAFISTILFAAFASRAIHDRIRSRMFRIGWWAALVLLGSAGLYVVGLNLLTLVALIVGAVGLTGTIRTIRSEKSSSGALQA